MRSRTSTKGWAVYGKMELIRIDVHRLHQAHPRAELATTEQMGATPLCTPLDSVSSQGGVSPDGVEPAAAVVRLSTCIENEFSPPQTSSRSTACCVPDAHVDIFLPLAGWHRCGPLRCIGILAEQQWRIFRLISEVWWEEPAVRHCDRFHSLERSCMQTAGRIVCG
jgi:hypothetical protein